ncbi:hypothetical protein D3C71_1792200 [compost metagenome]
MICNCCACMAWRDCRASSWFVACIACRAPVADWLRFTRSVSARSSEAKFCIACDCTCVAVRSASSDCFQRARASVAICVPEIAAVYDSG